MKISKKTDIAIKILLHMRNYQIVTPTYVSAHKIALELNVSYNHIRKIISDLNDLGFIDSRLGKNGGIALATDYNSISFEKLLLKLEEHQPVTTKVECNACMYITKCSFDTFINRGLDQFFASFSEVYLDDI